MYGKDGWAYRSSIDGGRTTEARSRMLAGGMEGEMVARRDHADMLVSARWSTHLNDVRFPRVDVVGGEDICGWGVAKR